MGYTIDMKKKDIQVGRWVRTKWDDGNDIDGIVVDKNDTYFYLLGIDRLEQQSCNYEQITEIGYFITEERSGLSSWLFELGWYTVSVLSGKNKTNGRGIGP